jgi:hypothetical protein
MKNPGSHLLFPAHSISSLVNERSSVWQELVSGIQKTGLDSPDQLAFILMMTRLNNCSSCNADSFRASQGCSICSKQSLKRFHGSDKELTRLYKSAQSDVGTFLRKNPNKYAGE